MNLRMNKEVRKRILGILAMAAAAALLILTAVLLRGKESGEEKEQSSESGTVQTGQSADEKTTVRDFAMGSAVTFTAYGEKEAREEASGMIPGRIGDLDLQVISWRSEESELAKWNRNAKTGEDYEVSNTLYQAVAQAERISMLSGGALDLTLRPVLDTWGIEDSDPAGFQVPSDQELAKAASRCGMNELALRKPVLERAREEITLDLGSVGKGYALDIAYQTLTLGDHSDPFFVPEELKGTRKSRVTGGVLSVGGSVMVFGSKPDGTDFQVGVRDPEGQPDDLIGTISIPAGEGRTCISTSGGYEKYIEKDGVRYHHIINPYTLKPAESGLKSVTVVCGNETGQYGGLISDGLSTACFILGETQALGLLGEYQAEAVMIRDNGSIFVTNGLKEMWKETK